MGVGTGGTNVPKGNSISNRVHYPNRRNYRWVLTGTRLHQRCSTDEQCGGDLPFQPASLRLLACFAFVIFSDESLLMMARMVGMPLLAQERCADREDYVKQRTTDHHSGSLGQDRKPHGFQGQMMYISMDCAREWSVIDFAIFVRPTLYSRWMQGFNWFDE